MLSKKHVIIGFLVCLTGIGVTAYQKYLQPLGPDYVEIQLKPPVPESQTNSEHPKIDAIKTSKTNAPSNKRSTTPIVITLRGAVQQAGNYTLTGQTTLKQFLDDAGGLLSNADLSNIDLTKTLQQSATIDIPFQSYQINRPSTTRALISINTGMATELTQVKGIGPKMAARIIDYRNTHGPFKSLEDLGKVKGLGKKTREKIAPFIRFN